MNHNIFLGLGSNLGHRAQNIRKALCQLKKILTIDSLSKIYKSTPWGYPDQPNFINLAIKVSTKLTPQDLLRSLKNIENKLGRTKSKKWGPRLIDIDILFYGKLILHSPELDIPHPYISEREFVLLPLNDLDPELVHPESHKSLSTLYQEFKEKLNVE